jgi:hypothetical protein
MRARFGSGVIVRASSAAQSISLELRRWRRRSVRAQRIAAPAGSSVRQERQPVLAGDL